MRRKGFDMRIEIVADLVCPWCYIGWRRLDRALSSRPDITARIVWRSFLLTPDLPAEGMPYRSHLALRFGGIDPVGRATAMIAEPAAEAGVDFALDRIRRMPNSLDAHRLHRWAIRSGHGQAIAEALFKAFFVEGRDLGDTDELVRIAGAHGLDPRAAGRHLDSTADRQAVLSEHLACRRLGIKGVPCFIIDGKYMISGAQDPECFLPLFDLARTTQADPAILRLDPAAGRELATPTLAQ